jgi:ComF family protein
MAMPGSADPRSRLARLAGGVLRRAADALLPPACFACGEPVAQQGLLCAACFPRFRLIGPPLCHCCGLPFAHAAEAGEGGLCPACLEHPPAYDRARAAWLYDDASKPVLLAFKYGDRTDLAPAFARAMAAAGATLLAEADVVAPVPLHRARLIGRRYNQAALLAHALGAIAGRPVAPTLLVRTRATAPLADLSARARRRALAGAIAVSPRLAGRVRGARVLLLDDVLTSGATADACATALLAAGAAGVDVLTTARTPAPAASDALDATGAAGDLPVHG